MAASPSFKESKPRLTSASRRDKETQKEFDRQQSLLAADFDKRTLKGNAVTEDWRHHKVCTDISQKERRENYQLRLEKQEMLKAIHKVKSGYTGHYDESKSPMENIQEALRVKSKTPVKTTSKLTVPNNYSLRKVKSQDSLMLNQSRSRPPRCTSPMAAMGQRKSAASSHENSDNTKTPQKSQKCEKRLINSSS